MATPQGPFYKALGLKIRSTRNASGKTQAQLAALIGFTRTSITNIESGNQPLDVHLLVRIADVLRCSPSQLLPTEPVDTAADEKLKHLPNEVKAWVAKVIAKPEDRHAR